MKRKRQKVWRKAVEIITLFWKLFSRLMDLYPEVERRKTESIRLACAKTLINPKALVGCGETRIASINEVVLC